jgi:hypothetical protein
MYRILFILLLPNVMLVGRLKGRCNMKVPSTPNRDGDVDLQAAVFLVSLFGRGPSFFLQPHSHLSMSCIYHPVGLCLSSYLTLFLNHHVRVFVKKLREQIISWCMETQTEI